MRRPLILLTLALPGCLTTIETPDLGPCAVYPDGLYDYGDVGIGTCLSGPMDVMPLEAAGGWRLMVANANPNLLFTSGSILALDGPALEAVAEEGILKRTSGEPPPTVLVNTVAVASGDTRSFSGPLVWDATRETFFYGNRLSFTTATSEPDRVEGMTFQNDAFGAFSRFLPYGYTYTNSSGDDVDVEGDETFIQVSEDPFALARSEESGAMFVVNTTSRVVTILDTEDPGSEVTYKRTIVGAKYPYPVIEDVGLRSNLELIPLNAEPDRLPTERWSITYLEPAGRLLYPVEWEGVTALALGETGNGLRWQPNGAIPVLAPYEEEVVDADGVTSLVRTGFDADGIRSAFVGIDDTTYLVFYEGVRDGISSIGFALGDDRLSQFERQGNPSLEGGDAGGLVLAAGPDAFDIGGAASPSVLRPSGDSFRLWYTAYDASGQARIARASGDNAIEYVKEGVVFGAEDLDGAPGDTDVADPIVFLRQQLRGLDGFSMYYVEGDLNTGTCIRLAESPSSTDSWLAGGEDGVAPDCLLSSADDLPAILRSPTVAPVGDMLRMWVSGAETPEGPWRVFSARSFDSLSWQVEGEVDILSPPPGLPPAPAVPFSVSSMPVVDTAAQMRVETDSQGYLTSMITGDVFTFQGLSFTVLDGLALTSPWNSKSWWGSPKGRSVDVQMGMGEPAILPEMDTLFLTAQAGAEGDHRLGVAYPLDAPGLEPLSAWEVPLGGDGLILEADAGSSIRSPWLMRPDAGSTSRVWLYYGREDGDDESRLFRRESFDGGVSFGARVALTLAVTDTDEGAPRDPTVVRGHDGLYHLWYAATLDSTNTSLRHATSVDGLTFVESVDGGVPVGQAGTWDDAGLLGPSAIWDADAGVYRLWYSGGDGARVRIGYAEISPTDGLLNVSRYEEDGRRLPVFGNTGVIWEAAGLYHPMVVQEGPGRFHLFFEGRYNDETRRIGYAISPDGISWTRVTAPGTGGDEISFSTATGRGIVTDNPKGDATISLVLGSQGTSDGATVSNIKLLQMETNQGMLPCFAILTARQINRVYVMDTFDDSASRFGGRPGPCVQATNPELYESAGSDWVDTNVNRLEEVFLLSNDLTFPGTRSIAQSPDGSRLYLTSANFDALLTIDTAYLRDDDRNESEERNLPVLGFVELARGATGASDDPDTGEFLFDLTTDIGPTGVVVSSVENGRYAFVANANESSIYTIDLARGAYGQVVAFTEELGFLPTALALSPDERWLFAVSYVGDIDGKVVNSTMVIVDAQPASPTFGQTVAHIKNREL